MRRVRKLDERPARADRVRAQQRVVAVENLVVVRDDDEEWLERDWVACGVTARERLVHAVDAAAEADGQRHLWRPLVF